MPQVAVEKVNGSGQTPPIFEKIAERLKAVQRRAFDLFERRGGELGHDLEDWVQAERELFGWPAAELTEKDGAYQLEISLPGVQAKDVEVTVTPTEVIVHASTQDEKKVQKGTVLWTEFGSNDVYRRIALLNPVNVEKVTAILENGILKINASETAKPTEAKAAGA